MQRSDKRFVILLVLILVLGGVGVVLSLGRAQQAAAAEGLRMEASAAAVRNLMELHYAMGRYHIESLSVSDQVGAHGDLEAVLAAGLLAAEDWRVVDGSLQRQGYRYRAILPTTADDSGLRFAVLALPAQPDWPLLAVDEAGELRFAPEGFTPDPAAPVDPHTWPRWR